MLKPTSRHILLRGSLVQRARLATGLVLFAFVATHLLNHALGLVGLEAMERFQTARLWVTRSWPGSVLLAVAALGHIGLALRRLAERQSWRMPMWEALQMGSGLLIPLWAIDHVMTTHGASLVAGTKDFYLPVLSYYWPGRAWGQTVLLLLAWGHGCIGVHYWLRLTRWYGRVAPLLLSAAVLLPALAFAGFMVAGREVGEMLSVAGATDEMLREYRWPSEADQARLHAAGRWWLGAFLAALGAIALGKATRIWHARSAPQVAIRYTSGPLVHGPVGATLLEISRLRGVPHMSVCGGRARCSTCRVRVETGGETLPTPTLAEAVTLASVKAPPAVRLACQIRPALPLTVTRLVSPQEGGLVRVVEQNGEERGTERMLAVMFLDLRGFTQLSQARLPYDVVYLLNRFFGAIGDVIVSEGGWIDKYMGDGLLAVFGRETGVTAGCRSALAAARRIDLALDRLNEELGGELGEAKLAIGIGLHCGPLVIGRIGHAQSAAITVIGRTVNVAARLEALTKERGCQLILSRDVARRAGWAGATARREQVQVRGVDEPLEVLLLARAREIGAGP